MFRTAPHYVRYQATSIRPPWVDVEMAIDVELPALGTTQTQNINFEVDKMPDPFSFTAGTGLKYCL